jgi:hypothetical protein
MHPIIHKIQSLPILSRKVEEDVPTLPKRQLLSTGEFLRQIDPHWYHDRGSQQMTRGQSFQKMDNPACHFLFISFLSHSHFSLHNRHHRIFTMEHLSPQQRELHSRFTSLIHEVHGVLMDILHVKAALSEDENLKFSPPPPHIFDPMKTIRKY